MAYLVGPSGATNIVSSDFAAKGDLLAGTALGAFNNLTVGADGEILSANSLAPEGLDWIPAPVGGGGGWTDDGATVRLTTNADNVVIGAAMPADAEKVRVTGGTALVDFTSATAFQVGQTGGAPGGVALSIDTSAGRVGVQTVTPLSPIHVIDNTSNGLRIQRTIAAANSWLLNIGGGAGGLNVTDVSNAVNVLSLSMSTAANPNSLQAGAFGLGATPTYTWSNDSDTGMFRSAADALGFSTAGVERVTITSTGISVPGAGALSERHGLNAVATGADSAAFGHAASSAGLRGSAFGRASSAAGSDTVALGNASVAANNQDTVVGSTAASVGGSTNRTVFGYAATASGARAVALGGLTTSNSDEGIAVGTTATVTANQGIAIGGGPFGSGTTASHVAAIVLGARAISTRTNQLVVGSAAFPVVDQRFIADANNRGRQFSLFVQTTNATQTELTTNGAAAAASNVYVLLDDSTHGFYLQIIARRTDVDNESAFFEFEGCIDRNAGAGTTALVGTVIKTIVARDSIAWDVEVDAEIVNGALRVRATGEAGKTIRWNCYGRAAEVVG